MNAVKQLGLALLLLCSTAQAQQEAEAKLAACKPKEEKR